MKLWKALCEVEVLIASEQEPSDRDICNAAETELRDNFVSYE
jgi:hypothetical protein